MAGKTNTKLPAFQKTQDIFQEVETSKNVVTAFLKFSWYEFLEMEKDHSPMFFLIRFMPTVISDSQMFKRLISILSKAHAAGNKYPKSCDT